MAKWGHGISSASVDHLRGQPVSGYLHSQDRPRGMDEIIEVVEEMNLHFRGRPRSAFGTDDTLLDQQWYRLTLNDRLVDWALSGSPSVLVALSEIHQARQTWSSSTLVSIVLLGCRRGSCLETQAYHSPRSRLLWSALCHVLYLVMISVVRGLQQMLVMPGPVCSPPMRDLRISATGLPLAPDGLRHSIIP